MRHAGVGRFSDKAGEFPRGQGHIALLQRLANVSLQIRRRAARHRRDLSRAIEDGTLHSCEIIAGWFDSTRQRYKTSRSQCQRFLRSGTGHRLEDQLLADVAHQAHHHRLRGSMRAVGAEAQCAWAARSTFRQAAQHRVRSSRSAHGPARRCCCGLCGPWDTQHGGRRSWPRPRRNGPYPQEHRRRARWPAAKSDDNRVVCL